VQEKTKLELNLCDEIATQAALEKKSADSARELAALQDEFARVSEAVCSRSLRPHTLVA
jgi:hypothetical protein